MPGHLRHARAWLGGLPRCRRFAAAAAVAARQLGALAAFDDTDRALDAYRRAVRLDPDDPAGWLGLGDLLVQAGDAAEAEGTFTRMLDLAAWAGAGATGPSATMVALGRRGDLRMARGSPAAAEADYREAARIARELAERDPASPERRHNLSIGQEKIGDLLAAQGDALGALDADRESLRLTAELAERDPDSATRRRELAAAFGRLGALLHKRGDHDGALDAFHRDLHCRAAGGPEPRRRRRPDRGGRDLLADRAGPGRRPRHPQRGERATRQGGCRCCGGSRVIPTHRRAGELDRPVQGPLGGAAGGRRRRRRGAALDGGGGTDPAVQPPPPGPRAIR